MIDVHQSIDEVLEFEVENEQAKKDPDYTKLQVIEQFKRLKADYIQANNKKKNAGFNED